MSLCVDCDLKCVPLIVELVQFERQKTKDACQDADNIKIKEVGFMLSCNLSCHELDCTIGL